MSFLARDGNFDVLIVAGPGLSVWPSIGIQELTKTCSDFGLLTAAFGGKDIQCKGVLPLASTGAVVLLEDVQGRIHRIQTRGLVRFSSPEELPDPFEGWLTPGLLPLSTAEKLFRDQAFALNFPVAIIGAGNAGLRFGSRLLEEGCPEVTVIASGPAGSPVGWPVGWNVELQRFERLGGKVLNAQIDRMESKGDGYELSVLDAHGKRLLQIGKLVSAGPFSDRKPIREFPAESLLFEIESTAGQLREHNVAGFERERQNALRVALDLVRSLTTQIPQSLKGDFERLQRQLKQQKEESVPTELQLTGKWLAPESLRKIKEFGGVPQRQHTKRLVASIECLDEIPCDFCESACPEQAIQLSARGQSGAPGAKSLLTEDLCTGCGKCLTACPSKLPVLIEEAQGRSHAKIVFAQVGAQGTPQYEPGALVQMLNRKGEAMGTGRALPAPGEGLVQFEMPAHLVWEVRGFKLKKKETEFSHGGIAGVEIQLDGARRRVPDGKNLSLALGHLGRLRVGDRLMCGDGSCGLCTVVVDGTKQHACQTETRASMTILTSDQKSDSRALLCPCLEMSVEDVLERMRAGKIESPEAVALLSRVGSGRCHGRLCGQLLRRLMVRQGILADNWIDWRFPSVDWVLTPGASDPSLL